MSEREFQINVNQFIQQTGLELETIVRRVGFEVLEKAKLNTRVDTGRARGSWNITEEIVDTSVLPEAPDGQANYYGGGTNNAVGYISGEQKIYVTNNLDYIEDLDIKDNIVDLTVAQVEGNINGIIQG